MSIVLNTNSNNSAYITSNQQVNAIGYPDINALLLKPMSQKPYGQVASLSDIINSTVKNVNGTIINTWSSNLVYPEMIISQNGYGDSGTFGSLGSNRSFISAINGQLTGGEIIGKSVTIRICVAMTTGNITRTVTFNNISVGLLHTDGTITTICQTGEFGLSGGWSGHTWRTFQFATNGVTAVSGDYVIAKFDIKSSEDYTIFSFGNDGGIDQNGTWDFQTSPIQISIE